MSWWEPSAFSNLASHALKTAQSKIDKVLDIQEESANKSAQKAVKRDTDDFFDSYLESPPTSPAVVTAPTAAKVSEPQSPTSSRALHSSTTPSHGKSSLSSVKAEVTERKQQQEEHNDLRDETSHTFVKGEQQQNSEEFRGEVDAAHCDKLSEDIIACDNCVTENESDDIPTDRSNIPTTSGEIPHQTEQSVHGEDSWHWETEDPGHPDADHDGQQEAEDAGPLVVDKARDTGKWEVEVVIDCDSDGLHKTTEEDSTCAEIGEDLKPVVYNDRKEDDPNHAVDISASLNLELIDDCGDGVVESVDDNQDTGDNAGAWGDSELDLDDETLSGIDASDHVLTTQPDIIREQPVDHDEVPISQQPEQNHLVDNFTDLSDQHCIDTPYSETADTPYTITSALSDAGLADSTVSNSTVSTDSTTIGEACGDHGLTDSNLSSGLVLETLFDNHDRPEPVEVGVDAGDKSPPDAGHQLSEDCKEIKDATDEASQINDADQSEKEVEKDQAPQAEHLRQSCSSEESNNLTLTSEDFKQLMPSLSVMVQEQSDSSEGCRESSRESSSECREDSTSSSEKTSPTEMNPSPTSLTLTSSNSFVRNMLAEAMVESFKDVDCRSSTSTEKTCSDLVRISSDINSSQTSGDEIDTTASSDIEVLSLPSSVSGMYDYGKDSRTSDRADMSPLKHALSRGFRRGSPPGHRRSDSGSSILSGWSRNGDECFKIRLDDGNSYAIDIEKLMKKMSEMGEVIQAREKKLLEFSHENIDLLETNTILKNQLKQSEDSREMELSDLHAISDEFTGRIAESEKTIHLLHQEKEELKKILKHKESELMKRATSEAEIEELIAEKDQQIKELLEEGEKLSKQQLQNGNIIKKLRVKEKENDSFSKSNQQKIEKQKSELENLHQVLDNKMENEKKQNALITHLTKVVQKQEMEINRFQSDIEDSQEKIRSMQVALDGSYKEMTELHKANAARASENQQAALSAEMQAKQQLQISLDKVVQQSHEQQSIYVTQIEDLQLSMSRQEKESSRREDILRQEISDTQQRLQEAEMRNQELTQSVSGASRPLLRQIENLQATYSSQTLTYERMEKNLNDRTAELQVQLASSVEKERSSSEEVLSLTCTITTLESQLSTMRHDKAKLNAQLNVEKTRAETLQEHNDSELTEKEVNKAIYEKTIADLKKDRILIENQLEMEKLKSEAEHKKVALAHEQLKEKELQIQTQSLNKSPVSLSMNSSIASELNFMSISQDDLDRSLSIPGLNGTKNNLYDSLRLGGNSSGNLTSVMEGLQSQLKQKDGEISQLQSDITDLEKTREKMSRELVNITIENSNLEERLQQLEMLSTQYKELDSRYNALLQMYGEKVEESDELRMDLTDIKDLYKSQINELTQSMAS